MMQCQLTRHVLTSTKSISVSPAVAMCSSPVAYCSAGMQISTQLVVFDGCPNDPYHPARLVLLPERMQKLIPSRSTACLSIRRALLCSPQQASSVPTITVAAATPRVPLWRRLWLV